MPMRRKTLPVLDSGGFRRMAYTEWGDDPAVRTVVCVHGLTRQGRDFDFLAEELESRGMRVACPDVVGRGRSAWLENPYDYTPETYGAHLAALIARLDVEAVDWVGTSMGGIIGMGLAALKDTPIRSLVLNDVGAFIPQTALLRLCDYVGVQPRFADVGEAEIWFREVAASFGNLTDAQWRHLTVHSLREGTDGGLTLHYDPAIALSFRMTALAGNIDLWPVWNAVRCPVLILRGAESDLLLRETAEEMARRKPGQVTFVDIPGCGHAPALYDAHQIGLIRDWLESVRS